MHSYILLMGVAFVGVASPRHAPTQDLLSRNLETYLTRFGYLPQSDLETGALRTEMQLRDAVRNLQFIAGLPVTGRVDPATVELMAEPRCGVPDVSHAGFRNKREAHRRVKRYNLQGQRWSRTNLTWSLRRPPSGRTGIDPDVVRRELGHALDMWSKDTGLVFREVAPEDDSSDLQVFFHRDFHGDGYPFDGPGSVLAHAFFPGAGRGGDVHFDEDENWSEERVVNRQVTSIFAVALHEFGHSLGLSHSAVRGSLMFPWYSSVPENNRLPQDDLLAIQHLYGASDSSSPEVSGGPTLPSPPTENPDVTVNATTESDGLPDKCRTNFDAVAVIRSEMWVFKGRFFWRINKDGGTRDDPVELSSFWYGLPDSVERVDAVYERPDHKIVFFVGKDYFILTGNSQLEAGPIPITRLGLPESLERIDAAMRWGWNGRTYLFSGTMYWRFDEDIQHIELDYPRDISMWKGIPESVDAVFQYVDKKTYFFKGPYFWAFDDVRMRAVSSTPTPIGEHWMHCPKEIRDPFKSSVTTAEASTVSAMSVRAMMFVYLLNF